ncbi:hypothetical protein D6C81_03045 [Aureobasidium pullulans]|nr:hypothetical protein D6C81_03045 [Aureobasidium pullulans]
MDFQAGADPFIEPGQPHAAQSDNARSPSPEETPDITPLCKLTAEEAEHDYQKQLTLLAEQTAHHDARKASEPSLDEPNQQIRLLESQVERQREVLGDSDPKTLETSHELCLKYHFNGQLEKAEELQRRIIDTRSRHLGESHPDTLRSLLYLTPILYAKGEEEAADQLQLYVLATRERVLGQSHADTIESVEQLAVTYENEKQWDEALPLYTRVQEVNSVTYGPDHCSTLEASCAVARMHRFRGHLQEAWRLQDATYQISMGKYGPDDDCTQVCVAELAQIANAQGNKEKARKLQQGVVNYYVAKLGRDHPWTMEAFEDMEKLKSTLGCYNATSLNVSKLNNFNHLTTMAPRKQTVSQDTLPTKIQLRPNKSANDSRPHFRFLDLSPELRNNIYNKIIENSSLILPRNNINRGLISTSVFSRVSKTIRSEFLPLALKTTPIIKTAVRNWDFSHIVNFLNRLSDDELEMLISKQRMRVDFWFSGDNADPSALMRWIERFDDERRGDGIVVEYVCANKKFARKNWDIAGFRACASGGPNGWVQFEMIAEVFE